MSCTCILQARIRERSPKVWTSHEILRTGPAQPRTAPHSPISKLAGPRLFPRPRGPRRAPQSGRAQACVRRSSPAYGGVPARLTWRAIPDPASAPSFRRGPGRPLPHPRPVARPSASATAEVGAGRGGAAGCREGAGVGTPHIPEGAVLLPPGDPWPRRPVVRRRELHFPGGAAAPLTHRLSGRPCEAARRG